MRKTDSFANMNTIGNRIHIERVRLEWSQQDLADKLADLHDKEPTRKGKRDLAPNVETVSRWEREVQIPSHYYRKLLSKVFQISEKELAVLSFNSVLLRSLKKREE